MQPSETKQKQTKKKNITTTKNIYLLLNKCVTYSKNYAKKKNEKTQKTKTQNLFSFLPK